MYLLYVFTFDQFYLFAQFGGFQGVVAGLLLALRQVAPDGELPSTLLRATGLRNKHLVGLYLGAAGLCAASSGAEHHHIGLYLFAAYGAHASWVYLRFFQPVAAAVGAGPGRDALCGDPREEFSFAALWPPPCQPLVARVTAPLYRIFCVPPSADALAAAAAAHEAAARAAAPAEGRPSSAALGRLEELGARGLRLLQQRMASFGSGAGEDAAAAVGAATAQLPPDVEAPMAGQAAVLSPSLAAKEAEEDAVLLPAMTAPPPLSGQP
jgi:hypothetical protein